MSKGISKRAALTGLAVAGVLSVGIAAPIAAYAADRDGRPPAGSYNYGHGEGRPGHGEGRPGDGKDRATREAEFAAALAEELGIPEDQVADALGKVREQLHPAGKPGQAPESPAPSPTK